jgi:N-acyl-D-glutamate deacylase
MDADIVVFDPETIADVGTYQDPNHPAVGVHWLLVNGKIVVNNTQLDTDVKAGEAIRR